MSTEEHNREMMIEAMRDARGEALPENPPPGPKWKAKQALNSLNLNGAEHDVMGCLVDRANARTGLCYPSEEFIAGWTNRPLRTVERAIASLKRKRLIKIIHRGTTSNRYYIDWHRLFASFRAMMAFQKRRLRQSDALQKVADHPVKSGGSYPPEVADKPRTEPRKENLGHEMAHSPSANDACEIFLFENPSYGENQQSPSPEERHNGFQGEYGSTTTKTKNTLFWVGRLQSAEAELKVCKDPARRQRLTETVERARSHLA
jgi:hypothetical protein